MSEAEQNTHDIELSIEEAQELVKTGEALQRLFQNADFKEVILQGYFKDEPARLCELKAAPQMSGEQLQAMILKSIDGIGSLQQYFNTIRSFHQQSEQTIRSGMEALAEIAEEAGEIQ